MLAFLMKRYYGKLAYGKAYGVIFALFYLGSGLGITGLTWLRQLLSNPARMSIKSVSESYFPEHWTNPPAGV